MNLDEIRTLYAYNEWANARMTAVMASLDEARLKTPLVSSFPSVLATFGHIVGAEWVWLSRWKGTSPTAFPDWLADPAFPVLQARLSEIETERAGFLLTLREEQLRSPLSYRKLGGEPFTNRLVDLLIHVVNHSSYHRGQLTTLLRQVGATPLATDFILFKREQGESGMPH